MPLQKRIRLIEHLEINPDMVPAYGVSLSELIAESMQETFTATDPVVKKRLAAIELRARGVLERWRCRCGKN